MPGLTAVTVPVNHRSHPDRAGLGSLPPRTSGPGPWRRTSQGWEEPLAHFAQGCWLARGSELCPAGSPCSTALLVPWPGHWDQASLASCGLGTGHSWEWAQENRKGGSCWPWSEFGPSFTTQPPPNPRHPTRRQPYWPAASPLQIRR